MRAFGYSLLYCGAVIVASVAAPFSRKLRRGLMRRITLSSRLIQGTEKGPTYWFHVASSGELEQAIPICEALRRSAARPRILLTYFSPSAERAVALERERRERAGTALPWDIADFSPFDWPKTVERFIRTLSVRKIVLIHRELWPGLLSAAQREKIPVLLAAAHVSRDAQPRFRSRPLETLDFIGTVNQESAHYLRARLPRIAVEALGDPRIDRVESRRKMQHKRPAWHPFFESQKVFIAASIWNEDLKALLPTLDLFLHSAPGWRILLAPHEPHPRFVAKCLDALKALGASGRRWSHWCSAPDLESALVIDRVGELAELYQISSLVFVGGSFKRRIHNVLEPAVYGNAILTGPFTHNSAEATEMANGSYGLFRAEDAEGLKRLSESLVQGPEKLAGARGASRRYLEERRGAGNRYADAILNHT